MIISINYAIFAVALFFSLRLFRSNLIYRDAATHLLLFSVAALLGGLAHHIVEQQALLKMVVEHINPGLPPHFQVSPLAHIYLRIWFATYITIGLTEYYFMRVFLHPVAEQLGLGWVKKLLKLSLFGFCVSAFFLIEYSLVITYHLVTHSLVAGFSLYLILGKGLKVFYHLLFLVLFNLAAGGIWALMASQLLPTGPLHYNDWYHLLIIGFILYLYWALTRGGLVQALKRIKLTV